MLLERLSSIRETSRYRGAREDTWAQIVRSNRVNRILNFDRGFDAVPEIERLN